MPQFPLKSRQGGAYIMVLTVAMLLIALVLSVLTVTINSRRVTARYGYFFGLYDLAVAGNEQVFFILRRGLSVYREAANARPGPFIQEIMPDLRRELALHMNPAANSYNYSWGLALDISTYSADTADRYQATTAVYIRSNYFLIRTNIHKYIGTRPGVTAVVQSEVRFLRNCLDYYTLKMVELLRVAD